jgi:hypothetical protein
MIKTNIDSIGKWSNTEIEVVCDSCGIDKKIKFKLYTSYGYCNGEYLCKKCKLKKNNLEKWGVENVFQLDNIKEKSKKTNLEKRGVEFVSQSKDIQIKIKENNIKKFGVEHHLKNKEVLNKQKSTNLDRWGVENVSQSREVKDLKAKKYLENWGASNNKKSEIFRKNNFKIANHKNYLSYKENGISLFRCDNNKEHDFEIDIDLFHKRIKYKTILCTICNKINGHQSGGEINLFNFIKSIYNGEIIQNYKIGNKEIDIFLPSEKIGFEFNGIYWHSEIYKDKNFHLEKTKFFESQGIRLIHFWEDDWNHRKSIIESQIGNLLKLSSKIGSRNCIIKEIDDIELVKKFLNNNHIQGWSNSKIKIGLFHNEELVCLMTFDQFEGRKKMNYGEWNLNRFCNKIGFNVIGGASKLLNYFIKNYKPIRIISYADRDWSRGDLYTKLKFEKVNESNPDYKYVFDGERIHKSNFKRSITGISESELEIPKIWDCGKIKYEIIL